MMYDEHIPATLPSMTNFVDEAIKVFEDWGYTVEVVKSTRMAIDMVNQNYKRSKFKDRNGKPYGVTAFCRGFCTFTSIKQQTIDRISSNEYQMIGYAADEVERTQRLTDTRQSIMVALNVFEKETFEICNRYNLLSPLYTLGISRDGCWFCPNAAKAEREYLRKNHPDLVEKINESIQLCQYDIGGIRRINNWVQDYFNELEKK